MIITNRGLGGAQRVFHDHGVALREYYDVTEVVFNEDDPDLYTTGNPTRSLKVAGGGNKFDKIRNFYRRVRRLRALKRELHCDVAISHLEGADYVNLLSKGREKAILLIHGSKVHDGNINGPIGWLRKRLLMPLLYRRADRVVTVSRDLTPEMTQDLGIAPDKLVVITNSFAVEQVRIRSQELLDTDMQAVYAAAPVLVTSGRLTIQKNQAALLPIVATLLKSQPVKLIFIGDGELRQELVNQAKELGLRVHAAWTDSLLTTEYDVYFVGLQSNPFKYLRPARVFVFPSAWEGFPMALGEAMACKLACVAADCPTGPREMLAPESALPLSPIQQAEWTMQGVLLPMLNNPATLRTAQQIWENALATLLRDDSRCAQLGEQAYQRALDFTHEATFSRWRQLIDQTLSE